jgi:hypothetical protein
MTFRLDDFHNEEDVFGELRQGILTEGEDTVQLTSLH